MIRQKRIETKGQETKILDGMHAIILPVLVYYTNTGTTIILQYLLLYYYYTVLLCICSNLSMIVLILIIVSITFLDGYFCTKFDENSYIISLIQIQYRTLGLFSKKLFQEFSTLKVYFYSYFHYVLSLVLFLNRKEKSFSE